MALQNDRDAKSNIPSKQMRRGVVNSGYEYEQLIPAYFALELLKDETVKSFDFELNSSGFGKFDDLVITVENKNANSIERLAIQLKHREKGRDKLQAADEFRRTQNKTKEKGFNIQLYLQTFTRQEEKVKENYKFVLFTNAEFLDHNNVKDYNINLVKPFRTNLFNTNGILQFQERQRVSKERDEFFSKFFLISTQKNADEVYEAITKTFTEYFHSTTEKAACYITFFQQLRKGNYGDTKITRDAVILYLINTLLSDYKITPSLTEKHDKIDLVAQALKKFDVILLPDLDEKFIESNWKYTSKTAISKPEIELAQKYKLLKKNETLADNVKTQILCFFKEKPLFIRLSEQSKKILLVLTRLMKTLKHFKIHMVLVEQTIKEDEFKNCKIFRNLQDLDCDKALQQKFLENFQISLQGKKVKSIKTLKEGFEFGLDEFITPSEIFQFLESTLLIGKKLEPLPENHIPRTLLRQKFNSDKLMNACKERPAIIHCGNSINSFKEIIQKNRFNLEVVEITDDIDEKNLLDKKPAVILSHQLCCKNVQQCGRHFKISLENSLEYMETQVDPKTPQIFDNQLNIVCAESGFGKTTMMKFLAKNCPSIYWVVTVPLQQISSLFKTDHETNELLNHLIQLSIEKEVDKRVSQCCIKHKKIIFFFDGLDELSDIITQSVINNIKKLAEQDYKIWIFCSGRLKNTLEDTLGIYCIYAIEELSEKLQKEYVRSRLRERNISKETTENIIEIIFKPNTKEYEVLKVPLLLYIFTENLRHYRDLIPEKLDKILSLNKMYSSFIKGKLLHKLREVEEINFHCVNVIKKGFKNYYFQGCQMAALQICLEEDICKMLKIKTDKKFYNFIKKYNDIFGLVTSREDKIFSFIHYTFAEYFAATWLSDNFENIPIEERQFILQPKYNGIRRFFDATLAKGCPLHLAIIDQDISRIIKNLENQHTEDEGGRTPLHLAVSLGKKHLILEAGTTKNVYNQISSADANCQEILQYLENVDPFKKDKLLGFNAFEYADAAFCLSFLEELAKREGFQWSYLKTYGKHPYTFSFYCVTMGYINLLKIAVEENGLSLLEEQEEEIPFFYLALRYDQKEVATFLLNSGISLTKTDPQRQTALHEAVIWGHVDIVCKLLEKNIDIEAKDALGRTPLQLAAKLEDVTILRLLVENGADVMSADNVGRTALHRASFRGKTETVKYLTSNGAKVNFQDTYQVCALHGAVEMGHYDVVRCLVENGADKNITDRDKRTPLHFAAYEGHKSIVEYLIDQEVNVFAENEDKKTAKQVAKEKKHKEIVRLLERAEQSFSDTVQLGHHLESQLHKAAKEGNLEAIKHMVVEGANIEETNDNKETILHIAAFEGHTDIIEYLLSQNANTAALNHDRRVPLYLACHRGHVDAVRKLLNRGQSTALDKWRLTPLHRAAYKGHLEVVKVLVDSGVDRDIANFEGCTALHSAAKGGNNDVLEFLISTGIDINLKDKKKQTCLHYAAAQGCTETVTYLIEKERSLINETDESMRTALHWAVEKGYKNMIEILIRAGADVNIEDKYKKTPLEIARRKKQEDIVKLLEDNINK